MATKNTTSSGTRNTKSSNSTKRTTGTKNTSNTKNTNNAKNKNNNRNKRSSSGDAMKFLLVLVIAGIAITLLVFWQTNSEEPDTNPTGTPVGQVTETPPVTEAGTTPEATPTVAVTPPLTADPAPTDAPTDTPTDAPTDTPTNTPTDVPTEEPTKPADPTPEPTEEPRALDAEKAQKNVEQAILGEYTVQLINDHLRIGDSEFYMFCALDNGQMLYPFLAVDARDGMVYGYDLSADAIFELETFPMEQEQPEVTQAPDETDVISPEEAYGILCTYSKESLKLEKDVSFYDAEYDSELTLINGTVNCYRINLSEVTSDGKVRNRGDFFVSVDGTKCYYMDSEMNEFVLVR